MKLLKAFQVLVEPDKLISLEKVHKNHSLFLNVHYNVYFLLSEQCIFYLPVASYIACFFITYRQNSEYHFLVVVLICSYIDIEVFIHFKKFNFLVYKELAILNHFIRKSYIKIKRAFINFLKYEFLRCESFEDYKNGLIGRGLIDIDI